MSRGGEAEGRGRREVRDDSNRWALVVCEWEREKRRWTAGKLS
jgi:hypothetical protein